MNIGLDYDDTYTADPALWDAFIADAEKRGHKVYCVTCRRETEDNRETVRIPGLPQYRHKFTGLSAKRWWMADHGIDIDIWCDDCPESVTEGR